MRSGRLTLAFSSAHKWVELPHNPCALGGPGKKDKFKSGCLIPASLGAHKSAELLCNPCILGAPKQEDIIRSGYFTTAYMHVCLDACVLMCLCICVPVCMCACVLRNLCYVQYIFVPWSTCFKRPSNNISFLPVFKRNAFTLPEFFSTRHVGLSSEGGGPIGPPKSGGWGW